MSTRLPAALTRRELLVNSAAAAGLATLGAPLAAMARGDEAAGTEFAALRDQLQGSLVLPGDTDYNAARTVWNGMIDRYPAAVARCRGVSDVMAAVRFARDNDIPATVRGGGHNVAGKALRDGALTIDLGPMQGIRVDVGKRRGRAQGGVRWGAFDRETLAHDLVTTGGTVSTTGVAGLTLGGGLGWLMRKHGLSCDNLVSADVVTADGEFLVASETENADLFWALRGGGGNFGVVTSFEFALHPAEPVIGGMTIYRGDRLRDLLHFFRDYTATAPDSVTAMAGALVGPPETPIAGETGCWFAVCHSGPEADGERALEPVRSFGEPLLGGVGPMPYATLQTMFDGGATAGGRNYWRSNFMRTLGDDVIDLIVLHAADLPRPASMVLVEHLGGAVARVAGDATAFSSRDARYDVSLLSRWTDPADDDASIAWTRSVGDELRQHATGGAYVNYMAADEDAARVRATYEANFRRLVEVKRKYDPENFFSSNFNIAP